MTDMIDIERTKDIVSLVEATPVLVLTDKQKFSDFYKAMKAECDALEIDLTTEKGRKAIASMAYKVARTKTAIDDAGKKLNEEARARINAVDESRREIRTQLDALKDEVRKPLTDWEAAEEKRQSDCNSLLTILRDSAVVGYEETAEDVRARISKIEGLTFDPEVLQSRLPQAQSLRESTLATLHAVADRMDQEEEQRAELERLRAAAAERERIEAERAAAAAEEKRQEEARQAAAAAAEHAAAEQKAREEAAAKAAEERTRAEGERKAQEEREATERAHAEALAAERRRAEEAERVAQAERDRIAREEADRKQAEEQAAREQAAREADRAHRGRIMGAAKEAIMEAGPVDEGTARAIVLAIAAGNIPNTSIKF